MGTRSGRFMLQDLLGNFVPFLKKPILWSRVSSVPQAARRLWGYLLYQGRGRPAGRREEPVAAVRYLNQMLAAVALVLNTVVLIKIRRTSTSG